MMIDETLARLRTHRKNIHRYRRLLQTQLTELEREFIVSRLEGERIAADSLAVAASPFSFPVESPDLRSSLGG
jgi:hypothetical protein